MTARKIMLLGDIGVGKTSIVRLLSNRRHFVFPMSEDLARADLENYSSLLAELTKGLRPWRTPVAIPFCHIALPLESTPSKRFLDRREPSLVLDLLAR